jgi:prefoldin subunit 5
MSLSNSSVGNQSQNNKTDNKTSIIILLSIALIGSWIYFFFSKNQSNNVIAEKDAQYAVLDSAKNSVQKEYDSAMIRLNELTQSNTELDSLVKNRNNELAIIKKRFQSLVNKQNTSAADLAEARKLVSELNSRIDDYVYEIQRLQAENQQLSIDKSNLSSQNRTLSSNLSSSEAAKNQAEKQVDVGSTLNASSFTIVAIHERNSGKERSTSSSKRADKFRISFNLDQNRIATSGTKRLYVIAKDPSGNVIKEEALASGVIETREEGKLDYTTMVEIEYKQNIAQNVSFDLRQSEKYVKGGYRISVYQNGFKIGEGLAELR